MRRESHNRTTYKIRFLLVISIILTLSMIWSSSTYAAEGGLSDELCQKELSVEEFRDDIRDKSFKRADSSTLKAQHYARGLIENYADIAKNKEDYSYSDYRYTKSQKRELIKVAKEATAGCETDYDKIKAVCCFVADNIYYDYVYYYGYKKDVVTDPYGVWNGRTSICEGYTRLCKTMLNDLGIACMKITACENSHSYNAAYDSQNGRWIYFDATWCSDNKYSVGEGYEYYGYTEKYFDMNEAFTAGIRLHEIYQTGELSSDDSDVCYSLKSAYDKDDWSKTEQWSMEVSSVKNEKDSSISSVDEELGGVPVTRIREFAFEDNQYIRSIVLPNSIMSIGQWSFASCKKLKTIRFSKNLKRVGKCAFYKCDSLKKVKLPNGTERIDEYAFYCCKKLSRITIPKKVTFIGDKIAFGQCNIMLNCKPPKEATEAFVHLWNCRIYYPGKNSGWTKSVRKRWTTRARWVSRH